VAPQQTLSLTQQQFRNNVVNEALALRQMARFDEAVACLEHAASRLPGDFNVHYWLANTLHASGAWQRAVVHFRRALALDPQSIEAHVDLGVTLRALGQLEEASVVLRRATVLGPKTVLAHNNLGVVLLESLRLDEAIASFRRALGLAPNLGLAVLNLGNAYKAAGFLDEAIDCYRRACELDPANHAIHSNLVYILPFHRDYDAPAILAEARRWNARHARPLAPKIREHSNPRTLDRKLRVGYVSAGFCAHVQSFFLEPLLRHRDRSAFEIVAYSNVARPDATTARLRSYVDQWRDITSRDDASAAELVRADGIDVLIDLDMHMANNRLRIFAEKPAPVQICWLAYPGTTGLDAIDYRLTDPHLDPPCALAGSEGVYAEKSIALPNTFWCYDPLTDGPEPGPLPASSTETITFGSLNNLCKVGDEVIALWSRVLGALKDARLLLLAPTGKARHRVRDQFDRDIDIALDPFPANGHTTSLDALWMGVPVVTLALPTVLGRAGLSQAMNLGQRELVAETADDYVRIAVGLASDLPRLAAMRSGLRQAMQRSPLMDGAKFARALENVYRDVFRRWCERAEQAPPASDAGTADGATTISP
jgi:predicted O-linked N-acetylglucosamine transferase (SPINDLY family)